MLLDRVSRVSEQCKGCRRTAIVTHQRRVITSHNGDNLEYQPSGAGGTCSPPAIPAKGPPGSRKGYNPGDRKEEGERLSGATAVEGKQIWGKGATEKKKKETREKNNGNNGH